MIKNLNGCCSQQKIFWSRYLIINTRVTIQINRNISSKQNKTVNKPIIYNGGDFEKLVKQSTIFIDKTQFIKEILASPNEVNLITMPRRWGKSLNLDMLRRFLEIQVDKVGQIIPNTQTDNYKLFAGGEIDVDEEQKELGKLDIANDVKCMKKQGQYPVIYIDMKDFDVNSFQDVQKQLIERIRNLYYQHADLALSKTIFKGKLTVGEVYEYILSNLENDIVQRLKNLSELLCIQFGKKTWILVDEYDAIANRAYIYLQKEEADKIVRLLSDIFGATFKGNESLNKGVITGVQYLFKSGMLSKLNNIAKFTQQNYRYSQYYGVQQTFIKALLDHFIIKKGKRKLVQYWYNGYCQTIDKGKIVKKYNIWSTVQYLNQNELGFLPYWEKTGNIDFMKDILKSKLVRDLFNEIVIGKKVKVDVQVDFSVDDFQTLKSIINPQRDFLITESHINLILNYLYINGYLTEVAPNELQIPNQSIKYELGKSIMSYYNSAGFKEEQLKILNEILQNLFINVKITTDENEKIAIIRKQLGQEFKEAFQDYLKGANIVTNNEAQEGIIINEQFIQIIVCSAGQQVPNVLIGSEIHTKQPKGYVDIFIKNNDLGIIFELKYNSDVSEANQQSKKYSVLIKDSKIKIWIGLNVSKCLDVTLQGEILSNEKVYPININNS